MARSIHIYLSLHVAGEDWTLPSDEGWDDTNLAMFATDSRTAKQIVENTFRVIGLGFSKRKVY